MSKLLLVFILLFLSGLSSIQAQQKDSPKLVIGIVIDQMCYEYLFRFQEKFGKDGFVKLIFDAKYGELLGAHMIGANVTEMIAEIVAIRKLETTGHELIKTIHPHPTMSEAIMEAAAQAYGEVIHL